MGKESMLNECQSLISGINESCSGEEAGAICAINGNTKFYLHCKKTKKQNKTKQNKTFHTWFCYDQLDLGQNAPLRLVQTNWKFNY